MPNLSTRYALLTRLPLLQGISSHELLDWEESIRLDLDKMPASEQPIIRQHDTCSSIICLIEGQLWRKHRSADGKYIACSCLNAPAIVEPDRLFGLTPTYEHSYTATTDITLLNIRKPWLNSHLMKSEVFRLNLLNCLSAHAQKTTLALKPQQSATAEERLRHLLATIFYDCKGPAELFIQMKELARYISATRLSTSQILNRWNKEGTIRLGREHFRVPDLQKLLSQ